MSEVSGVSVEIKHCELCGRLFTRPAVAAIEYDEATGTPRAKAKVKDCPQCIAVPPVEIEYPTPLPHRLRRELGIK